uniref:Uncharacterized protein n=1 Tax=Setaria viridis TaxID=4556 RepID=A0A4U6U2T3_SETVI|nr:hypothetical protein SEVIR_7G336350v2 [Setaria viridis]
MGVEPCCSWTVLLRVVLRPARRVSAKWKSILGRMESRTKQSRNVSGTKMDQTSEHWQNPRIVAT